MVAVAGMAQRPYKIYTPYKAANGHVFRVGDTLWFGSGRMPDGSFKCCLLFEKTFKVEDNERLRYLGKSYADSGWSIDYFVTFNPGPAQLMYAVFTIRRKLRGQVLIDCAVAEGEIVLK
jgi:hypothetical protein